MHRWKYLKPLDTMERITRQAFCDNLDNYLERANKEDTGFVILNDDGKEDLVLCPAEWLNFYFDNDFGCIITSALRYAIRRETYMPSVVVDFIRRYMKVLDTNTIKVAIEDIENELAWGGVSDPGMWMKLKEELIQRQAFLLEKAILLEKENR